MREAVIALGLLLATAGAAHADAVGDATAAVVAKLKDPQSATFADVRVSSDPNMICGRVNAKNSFGGYAGPKEFRYYIDTKQALVVGGYVITVNIEDDMAQPNVACR